MCKFKMHDCLAVGFLLAAAFSPAVTWGQCACPGNVDGDSWVTLYDINEIISLLATYGPPYVAPASAMPCADVAYADAMGIPGGDGYVDVGDLIFILAHISFYGPPHIPPYSAPCVPEVLDPSPANPQLNISVNSVPWDGISPVSPGDTIRVAWYDSEEALALGFADFNLNVSQGVYQNDFSTIIWSLNTLSAGSDGLEGIDVGGGSFSATELVGEVFSFSFIVPDEPGPAYTIYVHPNRGSWRRIMYPALPYADIPVEAFSPGTLTITAPNGSEQILAGSDYEIQWSKTGTISDVMLEYSSDNGDHWNTIIASTPNDGAYTWDPVPSVTSDQCLVKVSDAMYPSIYDQSNGLFSIYECTIGPADGDVDGNCLVDLEDMAILFANWLTDGNPYN